MKYFVCLVANLFILVSQASLGFEGIPLTPSAKDLRSAVQFINALPTTEGDTKSAQKLLGEVEKDSPKRALSSHLLLSSSLKVSSNVLDTNKEVKPCNSCSKTYEYINSVENINKELLKNKINTPLNHKQLIVFVSFSLGDLTLQQLYRDIQKIGGQLVMRGLYKNSFRQTQKKIQDLKIVVDVDPTLFERFEVQDVPTFVITNTITDTETIPAYDKLKGNVSLSYALETFKQAGNKEAGVLLKNLREGFNE